jgi:Fanconi anemia group J protein
MAYRHYYVVVAMKPNGNMRYAIDSSNYIEHGSNRDGRNPVARPLITPRSRDRRNTPRRICCEGCISGIHGDYCDGSKPPWLFSLKVNLLNPGIIFREVASKARSVVLASGSLSPIIPLCAELDLIPPKSFTDEENINPTVSRHSQYRLQLVPKPLEANHIIDMDKQLLAFSVGCFPDGSTLTVNNSSYTQKGFLTKLGYALVQIVDAVPFGGILGEHVGLICSGCI